MSKRKKIICPVCQQKRFSGGLNLCSACLRNYKRKTRPSFYLGTCYNEISRRCKTFDPMRPHYYGLPKCGREEFINKFINDPEFLRLYKSWQEHNYSRIFAPSIDRIDNSKGYVLNNIRFIEHSENSSRSIRMPVKLIDQETKSELIFSSQRKAATFLNLTPPTLCRIMKLKGYYGNYKIQFA